MSEHNTKTQHVHFIAPTKDIDYIDKLFPGHGGRSKGLKLALRHYVKYLESDEAKAFKQALEEMG